jgi:hypothetical protein
MRPVIGRPVPSEPHVEDRSERTPFIAARLHELASPEPLAERLAAKSLLPAEPLREPEAVPEEVVPAEAERRVHLALDDDTEEPEGGVSPWKRTGLIAGVAVAAIALIGAWAGWDSVSSAEPVENSKAIVPPPTTYTVGDPVAAAPERVLDEARPPPPKRIARSDTRVTRQPPPSRLAGLEQQLAEANPTPVPETSAAQAADVEPAATAPAASLPLSNRVIARTIERIGYRCGDVASTSQILGKAFTVTCTSGHSYRAAPVRGRYHFRRLSGG